MIPFIISVIIIVVIVLIIIIHRRLPIESVHVGVIHVVIIIIMLTASPILKVVLVLFFCLT